MGIILALVIFGLIVTVHEFGHFICAKLSGIKVLESAESTNLSGGNILKHT